ncbi:MAG: YidC/Oxa1 family membrane protein insertase [Actinomycetota bacterium]|nr:YidC/Oxa1 family membrane protein insertase [Actinomycetota bacterium]
MLDLLRGLFDPLFSLMGTTLSTFHGWGAPWWLAIVMLTVVVRTLLFPLTYRQVKSMRKMQELKPEMDEIRARHKDDPDKQREETARLYQERKINPLGGCLPVLVQLPIFLVLYYTIRQFDKLDSFQTGGLFWFKDLTVADPLFILPVAYVLTMMASQELAMRNTAAQQQKIMRLMPVSFGVFLAKFPSGLFVYWVTSNLITICQNYLIYRRPPGPPPAEGDATAAPVLRAQEEETNSTPPPERSQGPTKSGRAKSRKRKARARRGKNRLHGS